MKRKIKQACYEEYNSRYPEIQLNRCYFSMYVEWWLHNIGYYITKPFCSIEWIKHVDINEWIE